MQARRGSGDGQQLPQERVPFPNPFPLPSKAQGASQWMSSGGINAVCTGVPGKVTPSESFLMLELGASAVVRG